MNKLAKGLTIFVGGVFVGLGWHLYMLYDDPEYLEYVSKKAKNL